MNTSTDSKNELELKKWEEWYALTKKELEDTEKRFEKIEEKMTRYSVLITFIIGIFAIKITDFIQFWESSDTCAEIYCIVFFICLGISAFIALFLYIISLEFETFYGTRMDPDSLKMFKRENYINAIYQMSDINLKAVNENKKILEKKLILAHMAYRFTLATIILTALVVSTYTVSMLNENENDQQSSGSNGSQLNSQDVRPNFDATTLPPQKFEKSYNEDKLKQG